jgi:hypothetical protein
MDALIVIIVAGVKTDDALYDRRHEWRDVRGAYS